MSRDLLVSGASAVLGALIALGLLFGLPTQVSADYDRCVEARTMYTYDSPPPCWVAVLTTD